MELNWIVNFRTRGFSLVHEPEKLLYHPDELTKIYSLRRSLKGFAVEAMEMFINVAKQATPSFWGYR